MLHFSETSSQSVRGRRLDSFHSNTKMFVNITGWFTELGALDASSASLLNFNHETVIDGDVLR